MNNSEAKHSGLKFSHHAAARKKQRGISDSAVNAALLQGLQISLEDSNIHYDENTKVVCDKLNNFVITVSKNTRNTNFLLSERTLNKKKSLELKAYEKNNIHAMCELAELYLSGELGEKDVQKAVELFRRAANKGSSHAMCRLSAIYEADYLGAPNQEEADKWMQEAAKKKNVYALAIIGQKLLSEFVKKYPADSNILRPDGPKKEILSYFNRATSRGSTRALWHLGWIYEEGLLGEKDLSKAIEFYVRAAKLRSPNSLTSLQQLVIEGLFSAAEFDEILDHILPSLVKTSIGLASELGKEQLYGLLGVNEARGLNMLEQIACKQQTDAMESVALAYRDGLGCETNLKLAQYWFTKLGKLYAQSAKSGNVHSGWKLGKLFVNGTIGEFNLERAEENFQIVVSRSHNPKFMYKLGKMYLTGKLGDRPPVIGAQLIALADKLWESEAHKKITSALSILGTSYYKIKCFKNAAHWLSKTPSHDVESQQLLANIYFNHSHQEDYLTGCKILKTLIMDHDVDPSKAFEDSNSLIDEQMVVFLQNIAETSSVPVPDKNSNQYKFQKYAISTLVKVFKNGELGKRDYEKASKYLYKLFFDFEQISAGNELIWLYIEQHLPAEYYDCAKNWALQIPNILISTKTDWKYFQDCILLLGELYKKTELLGCDTKEAAKWLYVASCFYDSSEKVRCDFKQLQALECNKKEEIVSELSEMTKTLKLLSATIHYRVLSRILGDTWYDNKFISQNIDKAIFWYTEASARTNGMASLALGKIYQHDKEDLNAATEWYMLSAQQGNEEALHELKSILSKKHSDKLSMFLNKYHHHSLINESEWRKTKPLMNLEKYPKTASEQYELGKHYLGINEKPTKINARRAAHWFRKSKDGGNIEAALELYTMYKSGIMGENVLLVTDYLYADILSLCCSHLREGRNSLLRNEKEPIMKVLNSVSLILKSGTTRFSSSDIAQSVNQLINQTAEINIETLFSIATTLNQLRLEFCMSNIESFISNAVAASKFSDDSSAFFSTFDTMSIS